MWDVLRLVKSLILPAKLDSLLDFKLAWDRPALTE